MAILNCFLSRVFTGHQKRTVLYIHFYGREIICADFRRPTLP